MEKEKELIVTLRVYQNNIRKDKDGNPYYENQPVKIEGYGRLAWKTFMKSAKTQYTKMHVEAVHEETLWFEDGKDNKGNKKKVRKFKYDLIETPQEIIDEVTEVMKNEGQKLTPDQERIAKLEAKIEALTNGQIEETDKTPDVNEELEAARESYLELTGKKPHHMWKLSTINTKIKEYNK